MRVDDTDGARTVTLDRPKVKNASIANVVRELSTMFEELTPEAFDATVIAGDGDAFSVDDDIRATTERDETTREAYERVHGTLGRVVEAALTILVPVVACVNGDAVGTRTFIVTVCGFAYATRDARFDTSFVNVGLVPDAGATVTFSRLVGFRTTKEFAFTGKLVSAERVAELDLMDEAIAAAELDATADETIETLAARPTETLALAKEAIHASLGRSWAGGLEREAHAQTFAYNTNTHEGGVAVSLEKRRPKFE